MCTRIRLGRGRALQEGPIFSPSTSQIAGSGQGDLGNKTPGNHGNDPGILLPPEFNITTEEEEIVLPDISTPPPRIFYTTSPSIPTPMISSSSTNIARIQDLINRDRRNSAGLIFTRL